MRRRIVTLFAAVAAMCGCGTSKYVTYAPDDFQTVLAEPGLQLVDVRTGEEFSEGHIAGASNYDVYAEDFLDQCTAALDKARPVAVYCRSGRRSANAALQLKKAGFKRVLNLDGGIQSWIDAGKAITSQDVRPKD